jgi:DNA-binding transcriptional MerR regulator
MSQTTADATSLQSIGAFSRRSRLSLKALRLYDELGVLLPARIDPDSGYRYYAAEQVERARLIGLLRRLDMPLARIRRVLDLDGPAASREVAAYWAEAEASVAVKRRLVAYLERHLEGRGEPMFDVTTRELPEQRVASMTRAVHVGELVPFLMEARATLFEQLQRSGARPSGPWIAIYHGEVNEDSDGPVEVCIPFDGHVKAGDGVTARSEPAHREAFTTITLAQCQFPAILDAYGAVEAWIQERGMEIAASPREVYFADAQAREPEPDEPFCDIAFPIR